MALANKYVYIRLTRLEAEKIEQLVMSKNDCLETLNDSFKDIEAILRKALNE